MKKSMYVSLFITGCLLGVMLAFQFRSNMGGIPSDRPQALTQELSELDKEYQTLLLEAEQLKISLDDLQTGSNSYETLKKQSHNMRIAAGLEPVNGAGIEVTMDNKSINKNQPQYDANLFSITFEDLLRVVNELRAAGAKAISINEQRIVSTSEIRTAGNFIDVNLHRLSPPYKIKVLGDAEKLESSLKIKNGIVDTLGEWGIGITVNRNEDITIPAYENPLDFSYATLAEEGEK